MTWTLTDLTAAGFSGFVPFVALPESNVPTDPGVYVVIRPVDTTPEFLAQSPAGRFKGKVPSVPLATLEAAWVPGISLVYIGKANGGSTGRRGLRKRLDEYRRHSVGDPLGHWGGRYVWQLADHADLLVGWKPTPDGDARAIEREVIDRFQTAPTTTLRQLDRLTPTGGNPSDARRCVSIKRDRRAGTRRTQWCRRRHSGLRSGAGHGV